MSAFRYSAWEFVEERGQFYLHQYLKEQPDLNYRNDHVMEEMKKILAFWMDLGVDGFRMDAVICIEFKVHQQILNILHFCSI